MLLFIGTLLSAIASANGCINDAARAWFSMGRDRYLPEWFGGRASEISDAVPLDPVPDRRSLLIFALYIPLAQIITFSILSGLLNYTFMPINMWKFRKKWPLGSIRAASAIRSIRCRPSCCCILCAATFFAVYLGYGRQLLAMMAFYIVASLWFAFYRYRYVQRGDAVHHALAEARGLLRSEC